jgi:hypothetical protein
MKIQNSPKLPHAVTYGASPVVGEMALGVI